MIEKLRVLFVGIVLLLAVLLVLARKILFWRMTGCLIIMRKSHCCWPGKWICRFGSRPGFISAPICMILARSAFPMRFWTSRADWALG